MSQLSRINVAVACLKMALEADLTLSKKYVRVRTRGKSTRNILKILLLLKKEKSLRTFRSRSSQIKKSFFVYGKYYFSKEI